MADFQHQKRQGIGSSAFEQGQEDHVEAEHDPEAARLASLADLRRYSSQGAKPPVQSFEHAAGSASPSERAFKGPTHYNQLIGNGDQDAQMDAAATAVKAPVPKVKEGKGKPVAIDHAPSVADVFDPERPALEGASQETVLAIIQQNVNDLYQEVLLGQLATLKADLSKTAPVPPTPFAMKLLAWVVETVASHAIGYIGGFLGKELFGHEAPTEATEAAVSIGGTEAEPAVSTVAKPAGPTPPPNPNEKKLEMAGEKAGHKAGDLLKEKMLERPTSEPSEGEQQPSLTTGSLLDEFVVRERHMLLAKKSDIMARLMIMHEHAGGQAKTDTVELGNKLRDLIGAPALTAWFRTKVTMEWLNFMARVSLGPRAEGQTTDLLGANTIDGVNSGGVEAQRQWRGADGMVEIMLDVPETVRGTAGVKLHRASIPSSYGAAQILQRLNGTGPDGKTYNLATIPVYRRIWLKTGESKLDESPAFVITPDGQIEADVGNTVLDAIGATKPVKTGNLVLDALGVRDTSVHVGESDGRSGRVTDEERKDPGAWLARGASAMHCMTGADLIREWIASISPQAIK